jgi:hypothetical protein
LSANSGGSGAIIPQTHRIREQAHSYNDRARHGMAAMRTTGFLSNAQQQASAKPVGARSPAKGRHRLQISYLTHRLSRASTLLQRDCRQYGPFAAGTAL